MPHDLLIYQAAVSMVDNCHLKIRLAGADTEDNPDQIKKISDQEGPLRKSSAIYEIMMEQVITNAPRQTLYGFKHKIAKNQI